jgi:hypothetical protein
MRSSDIGRYLDGLNEYFERDPLDWFTNYEFVLKGMSASYHVQNLPDDRKIMNRAIHTDLCWPTATIEPWGKLAKRKERKVKSLVSQMLLDGPDLWRRLIHCLRPEAIIMSFGKEYVEREVGPLDEWDEHRVIGQRGRERIVYSHFRTIRKGRRFLVFFGRAKQTPFGGISERDCKRIGTRFWRILCAREAILNRGRETELHRYLDKG